MASIELINLITTSEAQPQTDKKHRHEMAAAQLIAYALVATGHLEKSKLGAVSDDPWSGFNWPVAPTGSGSSVNSNPSNTPVDPFSGGMSDGYLQQLAQLFQEIQNNPTNLNLLSTLIELLSNCGNNPAIANDPAFQAIMAQFPTGPDGKPSLAGLAQIAVLMEFASTGGDTKQVSAWITQLEGMPGMGSSTMSSFLTELQFQQQNLGTLTQDFMNNGQLGYYSTDNLYGNGKTWIPCSQSQFFTYIGGLLGNDIVAPTGQAPGNSFSSLINATITAEFKELLEKIKHTKNVGEALILLMILLGTQKDDLYQNQLNGLAGTTNWLSGQTGQIGSLIGKLNPNEFSGAGGTDPSQNAQNYFNNLIQLYESTKDNPNASSLSPQLKSALSAIFNLKDSKTGNTLLQDYQSGDYSDLATQLNTDCGSLASGDGLTLLNSLKQISTSFTNQSQAVGTQIQAVTADDNQIVNFLKSFLNDSSSGITAAENAISNNMKTS